MRWSPSEHEEVAGLPGLPLAFSSCARRSPAVDAAADVVSVLVSFVVVRLGSENVAAGLVEHGVDADDRSRTLVRRTRKRVTG
jgi:hypothetical protein